MKHGWLVALILNAVAVASADEVTPAGLADQAEREQHRYLALSLRNQKLLEQQAESKARQLAFQLQSAQALAAIRKLSIDHQELTSEGLPNTLERYPDIQIDLQNFALRSIFSWRDYWVARLEYAQRLYVVKDGDTLFDRVKVQVSADGVALQVGEQALFLRGSALW